MATEASHRWTRETPWRQGLVLPRETANALGLKHLESPESTYVVVISHDCDLANEDLSVEPDVEIIVGRTVTPNGNFLWSKAPRKLHLPFTREGEEVFVELVATDKSLIPKRQLVGSEPDARWRLSPGGLSVLRSWLAVRYKRAAFPDSFVARMRNKHDLDRRMAKILNRYPAITAVYFIVDSKELPPESPYELSIFLTHESGDDPDETADSAESAAANVEKLFNEKCFDKKTQTWQSIRLGKCEPISEDDLPVSKQRLLQEWKLEHISLKAEAEERSE